MRNRIPVIPYSAAEMNLQDAPDHAYYSTGAYLREHLRRSGDERWKLPEPEFERQFFLNLNQTTMNCDPTCDFGAFSGIGNRNSRIIDPLQSLNPFGAFSDDVDGFSAGDISPTANQVASGSVAPGATKGNTILDAISGAISSVTNAATVKYFGQTNKPVTMVQPSSNNTMLIGVGLLAVVGLIAFAGSRK